MIKISINNQTLKFETSNQLFSPKAIDKGTLAMLEAVDFNKEDKVLDLGCGYGFVGIVAAKTIGEAQVVLADISPEAVKFAKHNATLNDLSIKVQLSDGLNQISEDDFTKILANVPYHTDFCVAKNYIEKGYKKLKLNGQMILVTKRKKWYKNKLIAVFGGVRIREINGYYVFISEKKTKKQKIKKINFHSKKLRKKILKKRRN